MDKSMKIKEQILHIRDTGYTNMFDVNTVQRLAFDLKFYELVEFIHEHKLKYVKFIMVGDVELLKS